MVDLDHSRNSGRDDAAFTGTQYTAMKGVKCCLPCARGMENNMLMPAEYAMSLLETTSTLWSLETASGVCACSLLVPRGL